MKRDLAILHRDGSGACPRARTRPVGPSPGRGVRWIALALGLLALCVGCESERSADDGADEARTRTDDSERGPRTPHVTPSMQPGIPDTALFTLGPTPATAYRAHEPLDPDAAELAAHIEGVAPNLEYAPCLQRAASAYASYHPHEPEVSPPRAFVEFALHWAGCPDSAAAVRLYYTTEDDAQGLRDYLERVLPNADGFTHIGVGRAPERSRPYRWTWAILLTERHYRLEPFPRRLQPNTRRGLTFELLDGLHSPEVLVMPPPGEHGSDPESEIQHADLRELDDGRWEATIDASAHGGQLWVEILAQGVLGPEVVALFPVFVGRTPPASWRGPLPPDESWIETAADAEALMVRLINQDRAHHGLRPLEPDPELASVARAHSTDMRAGRYFAHVSPTHGTLADRLDRAGYDARYSAENIARNPLVYDAQAGLMESLGHRANILSTEPTRVGVGVAIGRAANGERTLYITQNFARPLSRPAPGMLITHMKESVARTRRDGGLDPLRHSAALDAIASDAARYATRIGFEGERVNAHISDALEHAGVRFRRFRVQYQQVLELDDFVPPKSVTATSVSRLGVGVAEVEAQPETPAMHATLVLLLEI